MTINKDSYFDSLIAGKAARRKEQAALPIEEKIAILIRLQTINAQLARQKGRTVREPWNIPTPKANRESNS